LITGGLLTALEEDDSAEKLDATLEEEFLADEMDVTALEEECAFTELDEMLEEEFLTEELDKPSDTEEDTAALDDAAVADEDPASEELVGVLAEKLEVMAIEESPHVDAGISSGAVAEYSEQEIESKAVTETAPNRIFFFILSLL